MTPIRTLIAACALVAAGTASAAPYPSKPVTFVVPFPPGGGTDLVARLLANRLQPLLGQPVLVENKPGAATAIAARQVATAAPDGYSFLLSGSSTWSIVPALRKDLPYDPLTSFAPVAIVADAPLVLLSGPKSGIDSVEDLKTTLSAQPANAMYTTFGNGSATHFAGAMLANALDTAMTPVPYRGSGPALTALIGGELPLGFDTVAAAASQVRAGNLRALVVTGDREVPILPGVPTYTAAGIGSASLMGWYALAAPAGTPEPIVQAMYDAIAAVMKDETVRDTFVQNGLEPILLDGAVFRTRMQTEIAQFEAVAKQANITME